MIQIGQYRAEKRNRGRLSSSCWYCGYGIIDSRYRRMRIEREIELESGSLVVENVRIVESDCKQTIRSSR